MFKTFEKFQKGKKVNFFDQFALWQGVNRRGESIHILYYYNDDTSFPLCGVQKLDYSRVWHDYSLKGEHYTGEDDAYLVDFPKDFPAYLLQKFAGVDFEGDVKDIVNKHLVKLLAESQVGSVPKNVVNTLLNITKEVQTL